MRRRCRTRNAVDDEVEAVEVVEHHHVERGGRSALFLVFAHVQISVVAPSVGEPVNQRRITVIGKDHRLVGGEQRVEVAVGQPVRMFGGRLQPHEVHDIDEPDPQSGRWVRSRSAAARVSRVGTSPAQTSTTSGSPSVLPAHGQIPSPRVQCAIASSMLR